MRYVGIDPGVHGGVCLIDGNNLRFKPLPESAFDTVTLFRSMALLPGWSNELDFVVVEQPPSYAGKKVPESRIMKLGYSFGLVVGVMSALWADVHLVRPQDWQKAVGMRRGRTEARNKWKMRLLAKAEKLFPDYKFTLETADAALIAYYCREKYGNA